MGYGIEAFRDEINAAQAALDSQDFEDLNIFANRIMSNALMFKATEFALPGFMLKDFNQMLLSVRRSAKPRPLTSATASFQLFLNQLKQSKQFNGNELWNSYQIALRTNRKNLLNENESKAYQSDNVTLTHESFKFLVDYLDSNLDLLTRTNNLIPTLTGEMNRIYAAYGIDVRDTKIRALFVALANIDSYVLQEAITNTYLFPGLEQKLADYAKAAVEAIRKLEANGDEVNELNVLLTRMICEWREYHLKFNDPALYTQQFARPTRTRKGDSKIKMPETAKEKLADVVAEKLQEDIKRGK